MRTSWPVAGSDNIPAREPASAGATNEPCAPSSRFRRLAFAAAVTSGLVLLAAGPSSADVEAEAGAQAADGPVTIMVTAEAESSTAGITSATQLPEGIPPEWVSLASGPPGWVLSPTQDGYQVGAGAGTSQDAVFSITIGQVPANLTEFPLKTLLRYPDGREDAWIEEATPDNLEPENPTPDRG